MTNEEAYAIQAFGGPLEFIMATYEWLLCRKSSAQSEIRRHKSFIQSTFIEMGPTMLKACEHIGLEANHRYQHPRWKFNMRVKTLLKDLLISGSTAEVVVNSYLVEQEKYRANNVK